jgi:hypothetical protein
MRPAEPYGGACIGDAQAWAHKVSRGNQIDEGVEYQRQWGFRAGEGSETALVEGQRRGRPAAARAVGGGGIAWKSRACVPEVGIDRKRSGRVRTELLRECTWAGSNDSNPIRLGGTCILLSQLMLILIINPLVCMCVLIKLIKLECTSLYNYINVS